MDKHILQAAHIDFEGKITTFGNFDKYILKPGQESLGAAATAAPGKQPLHFAQTFPNSCYCARCTISFICCTRCCTTRFLSRTIIICKEFVLWSPPLDSVRTCNIRRDMGYILATQMFPFNSQSICYQPAPHLITFASHNHYQMLILHYLLSKVHR